VMILSACVRFPDDHYSGDYPELFTVAVYSLLGAKGHSVTEIFHEIILWVIDEDSYGRVMFLYIEPRATSTISLIISQSSSDTHVYFYPHFNFISAPSDELISEFERGILTNVIFPEDLVADLKERNDWNQPLNFERVVRAAIIRTKPTGPINRRTLREAHFAALGDYARGHVLAQFFTIDNYGRSIYLFSRVPNSFANINNHFAVVLFQPDGTFDEDIGIMALTELFHYQEILKEFMELNGWNQPLPHRP